MTLTKKIDKFQKDQNKMRRQALIIVKKLLKNKKVSVTFTQENLNPIYNYDGMLTKIIDGGQRRVTLEWSEKP